MAKTRIGNSQYYWNDGENFLRSQTGNIVPNVELPEEVRQEAMSLTGRDFSTVDRRRGETGTVPKEGETHTLGPRISTEQMNTPNRSNELSNLQKENQKLTSQLQESTKTLGEVKSKFSDIDLELKKLGSSFEENRKEFLRSFSDVRRDFEKELKQFEERSGKKVDTSSEAFRQKLEERLKVEPKSDLKDLFSEFSVEWDRGARPKMSDFSSIVDPQERNKAYTRALNQYLGRGAPLQKEVVPTKEEPPEPDDEPFTPEPVPIDPVDERSEQLQDWIYTDYNTSLSNLEDAGFEMEDIFSGGLGAYTLTEKYGSVLSREEQDLFRYQELVAKEAFDSYQGEYEDSLIEIDKAIEGTLESPVTSAGILAKVAEQQKDFTEESISAEESYLEDQYELTRAEDMRRNARLEGYTKAKLYSIGAEDSSAGLALMAEILNMANLEMDQKKVQYDYTRQALNRESRIGMANYANTIQGIVKDTESGRQTALDTYLSKVSEIESSRLKTVREREAEKAEAERFYLNFAQKEEEMAYTRQKDAAEKAYNRQKDLIDSTFKWAGLTGTLWTLDNKGQLIDTGLPTMDWLKYQDERQLAVAQLSLSQANYNLSAERLGFEMDKFGYEYDQEQQKTRLEALYTLVESDDFSSFTKDQKKLIQAQILRETGLAEGSLGDDPALWGEAMKAYDGALQVAYAGYLGGFSADTVQRIETYLKGDGENPPELSEAGQKTLRIDPMDIPGVAETISSLGAKVVQEYGMTPYAQSGAYKGGEHTGIDFTWSDGIVKTIVAGTVLKVTPSGWNGGYGGTVWVEGDDGLVYQYGHMPAGGYMDKAQAYTGVGTAPGYMVKKGDRVEVGDPLGNQASTGMSSGPHTHLAVIGATENALSRAPDANALFAEVIRPYLDPNNLYDRLIYPELFGDTGSYSTEGVGGADDVDYEKAARFLMQRIPGARQATFKESFDAWLEEGDYGGLNEYLLNQARANADALTDRNIRGRQNTIDALVKIRDQFAELEKDGITPGYVNGGVIEAAHKIGLVGEYELTALQNMISLELFNYRKGQTGAQFSQAEMEAYNKLFPDIKKSTEYNSALIESLLEVFANEQVNFYQDALGSTQFNLIYGTEDPLGIGLSEEKASEDDELLQFLLED